MDAGDSLRRRLLDAALADPAALERALQLAERAYGWLGEDEDPEPLALPAPAAPAASEDAPKSRAARRQGAAARAATPTRTKAEHKSGWIPDVARPPAQPGSSWTSAEEDQLRELYPEGQQEDILAALPGRSWGTITVKASKLGLRRRRGGRAPEEMPIMATARRAAEWLAAEDLARIEEVEGGGFLRRDGIRAHEGLTPRQVVALADSHRAQRRLPPFGDGADLVGGPHQSSLGDIA